MAFRLAHISDIHLGPMPKASLRDLMSKRITGYINWHRNRAHSRGTDVLSALVQYVHEQRPDHIAVTGDLINIGLDAEIDAAAKWLETLGKHQDVSLVPGNHDAYVRNVLQTALAKWAPYLSDDSANETPNTVEFPYLRVRGPVAIIGVNSAIATAPFIAAGRVGVAQCQQMEKQLHEAAKHGLFRVVMIHHPPVNGAAKSHKRLYDIDLFQKSIAVAGAELILHGHTHLPQRHSINGPDGAQVPVIGVPSASEGLNAKKPPSTVNIYQIDGKPGAWTCRLTAHSYVGPSQVFQAQPEEPLSFK